MERVSVLCLLLLCSLSGAEHQDNEITEQRGAGPESANVVDHPQPCPPDVHAVLREMSAKLAALQCKMETLNQLQVKVEQLQTVNQEQDAKLREVDLLKQQLQAQVAELKTMKTWANVTENHVESLRRDRAVGQVAFSASLLASGQGFIGPFEAPFPLVFKRVISNIGNAYNPNTGFFIAPVRGAYHFELYTGTHSGNAHTSGVYLVKNGERVVFSYARATNGHSSAANGATLLLEPGDVVFPRLYSYSNIFDSHNHHSSFSGHLLFPM